MRDKIRSISRKRALAVAGTLLLVALVVPFAVFAVPQLAGGSHSYVVLSGSMEPAISPGDVVVVSGVDPAAIGVNDVVTFQRDASPVPTTHRVVEVIDDGGALAFRTMGDANEDPDGAAVPASAVIGRVTLVIPYIGYVIEAANTPVGFLALVVAPFGLLALTEAYAYLRRRGNATADESGDVADGGRDAGEDVVVVSGPTPVSDSPDGFAVSDGTLNAVLGVLGAATAYALAVAYLVRTPWAVAALVAGVVGLALVASVKYGERGASGRATHTDGGLGAVVGSVPERYTVPVVSVHTARDLASLAADLDRVVVYDPDRRRYVAVDDAAVYVYDEDVGGAE
ncbi:signal peptidase I [Salarchaeum sp. JOR-1]|uniref:signal peptidase I n=1 Tax=Salarchaeum sp. JOR-1 TaxID=2599399 RepID=UPI00119844FD|nr:signal peptidase I [Salarchaeum sp. JOR-1]QDX39997.1 signal peptidase I [Salarchaeum sp. JOR-1]